MCSHARTDIFSGTRTRAASYCSHRSSCECMTLHRAFRISAKLLTLVAFSTLVGTGKLPLGLAVGGGVAFAVAFRQERTGVSSRWRLSSLPHSAWNGMLTIACLMTAADFLWGTRNALHACLYVLIFLMINKLLTLSKLKDVPQL